ncbi:MAG TPA: hypothetical protein VL068_04285, partial [Microthrixaceae bacterium]|nr:hypothetical protein [Microthrixaceae bacterium]
MFGDEEDQNPEGDQSMGPADIADDAPAGASSLTNSRADGLPGAFLGPAELSDPSELPGPLAGMLAMMQSAARLSFKSCDEQDACDTA